MSLILGLWSIVLEPGKTYSQTTTPAIQITNISFGAEVKGDARSVVSIKYPEFEQDEDDEDESEDEEEDDEEGDIKLPKLITKEAVLAILKPNVTEQVSINVSLVEDVEVVEFSVTGTNAVHVVGHYVRQEDFDQDPYSDSEYGSDDEDIPSDFSDEDDIEGLSGLIEGEDSDEEMDDSRIEEILEEKKATVETKSVEILEKEDIDPDVTLPTPLPISTPTKLVAVKSSSPPSASDSSADFEMQSLAHLAPVVDTKPLTTPSLMIDDDDTMTSAVADSPTTVETTPTIESTPSVEPVAAPNPTSIDNPTSTPVPPSTAPKKRKHKKRSNPKKRAAEEDAPSSAAAKAEEVGDDSTTLSKNQKKKLAKKLKGADGAAAPAPAAAAAPSPAAKTNKIEEKPAAKQAPKSQTLAGGLVITDAKKGDGPVAKSGKKVGMRYIGKLENGKIFDQNTKGAPLVFTLGRGEVIKGWDLGVAGMQVGGERKLVIPAALAYGKKGVSGIPGNSTLIFDVKLVTLK